MIVSVDHLCAVNYYLGHDSLNINIIDIVFFFEVGKLADLVLWQPALFGAKPEIVVKGGQIAWSQMGKWGWNCCQEIFGNENAITTNLLILVLGISRWFTDLTGHLYLWSHLQNLHYPCHQKCFLWGCLLYMPGQSDAINECHSLLWMQTIWNVFLIGEK